MRIAKATLNRNWLWSSGLAILAFAILGLLDYRLKTRTGVGTLDMMSFAGAVQYRAAFFVWAGPNAAAAGFNLGFSYLLMPLYAASFFYSGIITAEAFAPRPNLTRRIILMAALAPLIGAAADAVGTALQISMLVGGPDDTAATLAAAAGRIKEVTLFVGLALFLGAVMARFQARRGTPQTAGARPETRAGFGDKA
jgi:hypothetical protein